MLRNILILLLTTLAASCSDPAGWQRNFLARTVSVGGRPYAYRILLPARHDPNVKTPVMLFLHGSGARGEDNTSQIDTLHYAIEPLREKIDFIIVAPQCRSETFWASSEMADYALAALDAAVAEFNGDNERLYLAGFSLGGYGVWQIAAANPGKFAALVPIAGGVIGVRPIEALDRAAIIPEVGKMLESQEPYKAVAAAIGHTPVWAFHGAADDSVPAEFSRKMIAALAETGNRNVRYTEYPNDGHQIFGKAFSEPGLLEWLSEQVQDRPK